MLKVSSKCIFAFLMLSASFVFCAEVGDALLALVGDRVITTRELFLDTRDAEMRLAMEYSGRELEQKIIELRKNGLDNLIERELCYLEFKELKAKVPPDYLQSRINEIVKERSNGNVAAFEEALHKEGMTFKEFKEELEKEIAVVMLFNEKTNRGNIISEQEIKKYYEDNKARLTTDSSYRLSVIQLKKDGEYKDRLDDVVKEIYGKLRNGTSFEKLAKEYSEGANASGGGDQGWMSKLNEKLMAVVNELAVGQTAMKPVEIGSSLYIVNLADMKKGGVPVLDAKLHEEIKEILVKEEKNRRYKKFVDTLYMKYPVHRMDGSAE